MMNLHAIVRNTITALHPDETVTLYQSLGQVNVLGRVKPSYAEGVVVQAQIQTLSADELAQREDASKTEIHAKAYLMADEAYPPAGIIRKFARNGDFIRREDGTWWLITSVSPLIVDEIAYLIPWLETVRNFGNIKKTEPHDPDHHDPLCGRV